MISPLRELRRGEPITADFLNSIVRQLRAICPQSSGDILANCQPGGTTYKLRRLGAGTKTKSIADLTPFEVYTAPPADPNNPDVGDWRRFVVHAATVGNHTIDNDDSSASPLIIALAAGTTNYFVWFDATLDSKGIVTAVTIASGPGGEPAQPAGDDSTGDPPSHFYLKIARISVGSDNPTDAKYQQVTTYPYIENSQWLDIVGYEIKCDDLNGIILLKRISARAV